MSLKKASRTKSLSLSDDFPARLSPVSHQQQQHQRSAAAAGVAGGGPLIGVGGRVGLKGTRRIEDTGKIFKYIDDNVIGKGVAFLGPFGRRKVVYADYSSSGRSLQFLEDYINKEVLPAYGDINCTSSVTGLQSQLYYKEAKDLIRSAVNASADDEIVFCEAAYTSPVERIAYILCLKDSTTNSNGSSNGDDPPTAGSPVLFCSTSEPVHNVRPWLELGVQVERIAKTHEGYLDLVDLEKRLVAYVGTRRRLIGLFSGASRLTGILADDVATTILLHQYGALSVWDYSPAAPCTMVDTNPALPGATKDAVFFCANKFVGGVQAPGVLILKKVLLTHSHQKIYDSVGIVGAVRAGLVIQLKESLGTQAIMNRHEKLCKQLFSHIRTIPEIILLGSLCETVKRLPTICFMVRHSRGTYLHHRFVVAVLNDVFGIQATAHNTIVEAMSITPQLAVQYERLQLRSDDPSSDEDGEAANIPIGVTRASRATCLAPGYTQITLPFFMADSEVGFVLEALKMVATEAWKLLPQYECDEVTAEWRHQSNALVKERKWLGAIRYTDGRMLFNDRRISGPGLFPQNNGDCLQTARNIFNRARKMAQRAVVSTDSGMPSGQRAVLRMQGAQAEALRWYMLPGEAHELLLGHSQNVKHVVPFDPNKSLEPPSLLNIYHRHFSLPALDTRRFKSQSLPTSPIHRPITRQQSSPSPTHQLHRQQSPIPERREPPTTPPSSRATSEADGSAPMFSLGGEVTTGLRSPSSSSEEVDAPTTKRNRCHTWSSSAAGGIHLLSPQTLISLGLTSPQRAAAPRKRLCSCSSQTDVEESSDLSSGTDGLGMGASAVTMKTTLRSFSNSNASINNNSDSEDIETYVKSITEGIADNLKSEIREVISRVEDVLDHAESTAEANLSSLQLLSLQHISSADDLLRQQHSPSDSVSASDVAEYLKEFSKGITSQVTSEIREVANAMNDHETTALSLSATSQQQHAAVDASCRYSQPDRIEALSFTNSDIVKDKIPQHRYSDTAAANTPLLRQCATTTTNEPDKQRSESFPAACPSSAPPKCRSMTSAPCPELSTPSCPYTGAVSKLLAGTALSSTMSQDSGINLSFCDSAMTAACGERDMDIHSQDGTMLRSLSMRTTCSELTDDGGGGEFCSRGSSVASSRQHSHVNNAPTLTAEDVARLGDSIYQQQKTASAAALSSSSSLSPAVAMTDGASSPNQWQYLPQSLWKQTAETIDEFGMLQSGDRVLVCLSGSSASLCLLHALRQFVRARHMKHVELAAVTLGTAGGIDPRALMLYLRDLGVRLHCEPLGPADSVRAKLQSVARQHGYNVLALASTVDKLADDFLHSVLRRGRLAAMQAHCRNGAGDLRIVRPFLVGVRERTLEDVAVQNAWPARPSRRLSRPPDAATSILRVQETINPAVYENIKEALRPLLAMRIQEDLESLVISDFKQCSRTR